jgi:hypothetical protein
MNRVLANITQHHGCPECFVRLALKVSLSDKDLRKENERLKRLVADLSLSLENLTLIKSQY